MENTTGDVHHDSEQHNNSDDDYSNKTWEASQVATDAIRHKDFALAARVLEQCIPSLFTRGNDPALLQKCLTQAGLALREQSKFHGGVGQILDKAMQYLVQVNPSTIEALRLQCEVLYALENAEQYLVQSEMLFALEEQNGVEMHAVSVADYQARAKSLRETLAMLDNGRKQANSLFSQAMNHQDHAFRVTQLHKALWKYQELLNKCGHLQGPRALTLSNIAVVNKKLAEHFMAILDDLPLDSSDYANKVLANEELTKRYLRDMIKARDDANRAAIKVFHGERLTKMMNQDIEAITLAMNFGRDYLPLFDNVKSESPRQNFLTSLLNLTTPYSLANCMLAHAVGDMLFKRAISGNDDEASANYMEMQDKIRKLESAQHFLRLVERIDAHVLLNSAQMAAWRDLHESAQSTILSASLALQKLLAEQVFLLGETKFRSSYQAEEELDMDLVWDALDTFTQARRNFEECGEILHEAKSLSRAAQINQDILKNGQRAAELAMASLQIALAFPGVNVHMQEDWYKFVQNCVQLHQSFTVQVEDKERQAALDAIRPELEALKTARAKSWEAFLKHIYQTHPVEGKALDMDALTPDNVSKLLREALRVYHPDKMSQQDSSLDRNIKYLREEITKILNELYSMTKGV